MFYLSIDVETSGPFPGLNDLCSIGAVVVLPRGGVWRVDEARTFYRELQPQGGVVVAAATRIHGLDPAHLQAHGHPVSSAMAALADWCAALQAELGAFKAAAWPVSFDAPYIGWLAHQQLGHNPLGHSGFDIASYGMGLFSCTEKAQLEGRMAQAGYTPPQNPQLHNALADAIAQGETLAWLLNHAAGASTRGNEGG